MKQTNKMKDRWSWNKQRQAGRQHAARRKQEAGQVELEQSEAGRQHARRKQEAGSWTGTTEQAGSTQQCSED